MTKKVLLVLIIAVFMAGGVFAQNDFASMAKNTITVDVGPTIAGLVINPLSSTISSVLTDVFDVNVSDINTKGFGIGAQYERQLLRPLSVALRGVYGKYNSAFTYVDDGIPARPDIDLTTWTVEGHVRFYPFGETFFVDGMVGYAQLKADMTGSVVAMIGGKPEEISASANKSSNYIKYGAKLGWRINIIKIGNNGGLIFEPAIGWNFGNPLNGDLGKKVSDALTASVGEYKVVDISKEFSALEDFIFVGGPRVTLAIGYRF